MTTVSTSFFGSSCASSRNRAASPSAGMWSAPEKSLPASGLSRRSLKRMTATEAASEGTSDSRSLPEREAAASGAAAAHRTSARKAMPMREGDFMSEVLSGKEPAGESQGGQTEHGRRAVYREEVRYRDPVECARRDELNRRAPELGRLREDPVEAVDELRRPFSRHGRGDLLVRGEQGRQEEDGVGGHERNAGGGRDDADQESEREERGDREQHRRAAQQETRVHDVRLPDDDEPDRSDEIHQVGCGEQHPAAIARQEKRHPPDGTGEVEIHRPFFLQPRHQVRRREERQERADEIEEPGEAGFEAQNEAVDVDGAVPQLDGLSEELRAGERAVDDVEIHGQREDQDEEGGEREVGDERPARRRLPEDFLHARGPGPHQFSLPGSGSARTRSTKTSSRLERSGVSSSSSAPRARRRSTTVFT